ncbi:MAG: hypothetical protein RL308_893 [Bacteroidota bacterium]|jgi:protein-L-isoaspartate O-methyltransferase
MKNRKYAEKYYKYFSKAEGNQHIANLFAIEKILDIVEFNKPKRILEVGLGIGSISYSIIDYLKEKKLSFEYYGTEANEFCLNELPKNLQNNYSSIKLFSNIEEIKTEEKFDLIIVDGSDISIEKIYNLITNNGTIFIEGDRKNQLTILLKLFPKFKFVHTISNYKEPDYGPFTTENWSGGGKLIYINPTLRQKINWLNEKIISSYRNRIIRKIYS